MFVILYVYELNFKVDSDGNGVLKMNMEKKL